MIKLKELLFGKPDCDCGCGNCEGTTLNEGIKISENLQYHLNNKIPLGESVFRISSNAHVKLFAETRKLWEAGKITLSEADEYFMSTDAGRQGMYRGQLVPLDLPYILNEYKDEPSYDGPNPPIIAVRVDDEKFLDDLEDEGIDHGYDDAQDPDEGPDIGFRYIIYGKKEEKQDIIDFLKHLMKPYGNDVRIDNESLKETKKKKNPPLNKPKRGGPKAYYLF